MALGLGAALVISGTASAQDNAAAEALFQQGLAKMKAERYEDACPAIAESYRLDPRPGVLFTLAACEAKAGHVASASSHYEDYLDVVKGLPPAQRAAQKDRERIARKQKQELASKVPTLTLVLPDSAPPGTKVTRDDVVLGKPQLGIAIPVDPGEHVVMTQAPGGKPITERIVVEVGEKKSYQLTVVGPPPGAGAAPGGTPDSAQEPGTSAAPASWDAAPSSHRALTITAFGVGAVGLGVGATTGILALVKKGVADDNCVGSLCNEEEHDADNSGRTFGTVSTIGFAVGAAGVVAGVILLATEGGKSPPQAGSARSRTFLTRPAVGAGGIGWRF